MQISVPLPADKLVVDPVGDQQAINRRKILDFEAAMHRAKADGHLNECDFPLKHTFTAGVYARELTIPKGATLVGKIHRHAHLNFVMRGEIHVMSEDGVSIIKAPTYFTSRPGVKRVGVAIEETVWITIHATNETDLEKIEEQVIVKDFQELHMPVASSELLGDMPCHG